ncbi:hypothetical protein [Agrobacterium pusense]|uniref:hypothetical protein n=1 Tax=Agrobacterium pusense TaxID=648995 RepID=UPI0032DA58D1
MKIAVALMFAGSVVLAAANSEAGDIKISVKAPENRKEYVEAVIERFREACRPLGTEFWDDVEEVSVDIKTEVAQARLDRGWSTSFSLALKYSNNPSRGPSYASGTGVLAGQTLHYYLGGGRTPGYLAVKRSSQYLCGLSISENGEYVFRAAPDLKILDY